MYQRIVAKNKKVAVDLVRNLNNDKDWRNAGNPKLSLNVSFLRKLNDGSGCSIYTAHPYKKRKIRSKK